MLRLDTAKDPGSEQWYALLQLHHLVCDHESLEIMSAEIRACLDGRASSLPRPRPYRDHVAHAMARANSTDTERFFRDKLGDVDEATAPFGVFDTHQHDGRVNELRTPAHDGRDTEMMVDSIPAT
jgi:hypothetical protein